jgi:hypothetical protein
VIVGGMKRRHTMPKRIRHDRTFHSPFDTTEYHDNKKYIEGTSWYQQSQSQHNLENDNAYTETEIHREEDNETGLITFKRDINHDSDPDHVRNLIQIERDRYEGLLRDLGKTDEQIEAEMERRFGND